MKRILTLLIFGVLATTLAFGAPLITFSTPAFQTPVGQIAYAGGFNPLIGTNIKVSTISSATATVGCVACVLNFATGNLTSVVNHSSTNRTWNFASGPSQLGLFTITGTVPTAGINSSTLLLNGYFNASTVTVNGFIGGTPRLRLATGSIFSVKNLTLVNYLLPGFTGSPYFTGTYVQDFRDTRTPRMQIPIFSDALLQGTVTSNNVVPEPGSVILFSSIGGVLALCVFLRYRRRAA